jgi:hypothetical protein
MGGIQAGQLHVVCSIYSKNIKKKSDITKTKSNELFDQLELKDVRRVSAMATTPFLKKNRFGSVSDYVNTSLQRTFKKRPLW